MNHVDAGSLAPVATRFTNAREQEQEPMTEQEQEQTTTGELSPSKHAETHEACILRYALQAVASGKDRKSVV
jgi:hypothetical protein